MFSGQPMVEKGHSAEENQVSSTSVSWTSSVEVQAGQNSGSVASTISSPQAMQVQAGIRCPHQICREMHQSRMLSIQL